jgi:hypothetical protein
MRGSVRAILAAERLFMAINRSLADRSSPKKTARGGLRGPRRAKSAGQAGALPEIDLDGAYEWTMKRYPKTMKRLAE